MASQVMLIYHKVCLFKFKCSLKHLEAGSFEKILDIFHGTEKLTNRAYSYQSVWGRRGGGWVEMTLINREWDLKWEQMNLGIVLVFYYHLLTLFWNKRTET